VDDVPVGCQVILGDDLGPVGDPAEQIGMERLGMK
jgi:hypothetical protein